MNDKLNLVNPFKSIAPRKVVNRRISDVGSKYEPSEDMARGNFG
jgi:hypothetical protein